MTPDIFDGRPKREMPSQFRDFIDEVTGLPDLETLASAGLLESYIRWQNPSISIEPREAKGDLTAKPLAKITPAREEMVSADGQALTEKALRLTRYEIRTSLARQVPDIQA
ncbi:hypothetical protein ACFL2V_15370 [Pseudomonadota bacterium]